MMRVREIRFWTTLVVAALSLVTIGEGWSALRLGLAEALADPSTAEAWFVPFAGDGLVGDVAKRDLLLLAPPAAEQARIDAVGGWPALDGGERARLSAILVDAPVRSGEEARAALLLAGAPGAAVAAALTPERDAGTME
jgi:hypothetical protein